MMRRLTMLLMLAILSTASAHALEDWEVRHLLTRTGFGVSPREYQRFKPMNWEQAVDALLDGVRTRPVTAPPDLSAAQPPDPAEMRGLSQEERRARQRETQKAFRQGGQDLKAWWYGEMLATDSPLTERMTLFWSNHFTSSLQKVRDPRLMLQQNELLRSEALGNFSRLTVKIARDPAMILYLDNASNRKGAANENFARELMELFTLGIGHYTETDVKQAARAFTGWGLNRREATFVYQRRQHDEGVKTFLGQTGNLGGEDVIETIMQQPATAEFVTTKLWREFVSPTPDPDEVKRLAGVLRENRYEIKPLMRALLLSPAFRNPANAGTLTKSPVDLMVGTLRTFELQPPDTALLVRYGRQLGQDLMDPPNVKGWPGGDDWIDSNTLLLRQQILQSLTRGADPDRREMTLASRQAAMLRQVRAARQSMNQLTPDQQKLAQRVRELRQQGMDRPRIVAALVKEGHTLEEFRALQQRTQELATERAAAGAPTMMMAPAQVKMVMPRLDPLVWTQTLGSDTRAAGVMATLLVPIDPVEHRPLPSISAELPGLIQDPAYELK